MKIAELKRISQGNKLERLKIKRKKTHNTKINDSKLQFLQFTPHAGRGYRCAHKVHMHTIKPCHSFNKL